MTIHQSIRGGWIIRLLTILLLGAIAACQGNASRLSVNSATSSHSADCRTIEHEKGETEICGQPQRIVALGPYLLEHLIALEVQPVAYADHIAFHEGDYDNPSKQIPYLGRYLNQSITNVGLAYTPSMEAILALKPDLIVSLSDNVEQQYQTFSQFAPTLALGWENPEANLKAIAQAVNREDKAAEILQTTAQKIQQAKQDLSTVIASHPRMLLLYAQNTQEISVNNHQGGCSSLITKLGFELASTPQLDKVSPNQRTSFSLEILPQLDHADSIIVFGYNFDIDTLEPGNAHNFTNHQLGNIQQQWSENAVAQSMRASQQGRVYFIPAYLCLGLPGSIGTELYLEELKAQLLSSSESLTKQSDRPYFGN